jgi:AsmA protein
MGRVAKISAISVAALFGLLLLIPLLIGVDRFRPDIEREISSALGREVRIGSLALSLLSASVSATELTIADDRSFSAEPFVRAASLKVGVELVPLVLSKELRVTEISIDRPEIVLIHGEGGKWNFSSLAHASRQTSSSNEPTAPAPEIAVAKLSIEDGSITVKRAKSSAAPHVYEEVNVLVRDFSLGSRLIFAAEAKLPGGGTLDLEGKAGPIDRTDAALTPLEAKMKIDRLNLSVLGVAGASIAGLADFDGSLVSSGGTLETTGKAKIDQIKLVEKGSPAGAPVEIEYSVVYDLVKQSAKLTQGNASTGKALAQLTGKYETRGESKHLDLDLVANAMPIDDLEPLLPALGVALPTGSSLEGGTLSARFDITGPAEKPVITGPIEVKETVLAGFDLGAKMSAISALSGVHTGPNTRVHDLSSQIRVAAEGTRAQKIHLSIEGLGTVVGNGTIDPKGALDFKMRASLTKVSIPFLIRGTASDPSFVPDVAGIVEGTVGGVIESTIGGIFGRRK